jgi:hypothetical protein
MKVVNWNVKALLAKLIHSKTYLKNTLVSIGPGERQLNLIPYLPHSDASDLIQTSTRILDSNDYEEESNTLHIFCLHTSCMVVLHIYIGTALIYLCIYSIIGMNRIWAHIINYAKTHSMHVLELQKPFISLARRSLVGPGTECNCIPNPTKRTRSVHL